MNLVTLIWNYRRKGLNDWVSQRFSVIFPIIYVLAVLCYALVGPNLDDWRSYIFSFPMRILGTLAALSVVWHIKIGLWVVVSDYIPRGFLRFASTIAVYVYVWLMLVLFVYLYWSS